MPDEIIVPVPDPEPAPEPEQTVIVNNVLPPAETDPEPEPTRDLAEELDALRAECAARHAEHDERLRLMEAENDALMEWLEEEFVEAEEEPAAEEPVPDVPPIPEAAPDTVNPGESRRASWDYFAKRRQGG